METSTEEKLRHLLKNKKFWELQRLYCLLWAACLGVCTLQTYSQIYTFFDSGCGEIA